MQAKQIAMITLILAALNVILGVVNAKWYLIAAAVVMAVIAVIGAVKYLTHPSPQNLRSFSWYNIIAGLSILSLAWSSFYGLPTLGFVQVLLGIALTALGCYTLYEAVKKHNMTVIP